MNRKLIKRALKTAIINLFLFSIVALIYAFNIQFNDDAVLKVNGIIVEDKHPYSPRFYFILIILWIGVTIVSVTKKWARDKLFQRNKPD